MKNICLITGSSGLIGSESVVFLQDKFDCIIGIDNDMRARFFGPGASTIWNRDRLLNEISNFESHDIDIRDINALEKLFKQYNSDIGLVIHAAAQPSHDWAAREPLTDFTVNANGTLNMLEMSRKYCPGATFIYTSTNKVYGDAPNFLPLIEMQTRYEIEENHPFHREGINETMSIDQTKHSLFGASKVAADILVQEYGRYFNMNTAVFRGGCLTGPNHSGTELHGFLSYLVKCAVTGEKYTIFGYKGKQVRDNIHSYDLVNMFWHFHQQPRMGEVYNAGGGRHSNISMLEAITMCEQFTGKKMNVEYVAQNRIGDHIWYISDVGKFKNHYPGWSYRFDLNDIFSQLFATYSTKKKG